MIRILLIEDDEVDRQAVKRSVKASELEATVVEARTGREGLEIAAREKFDCILLDFGLPDMDGMDVVCALTRTAEHHRPPIIVLTGRRFEDVAIKTLRAGAEDFIEKDDLDPVKLAHTIEMTIERHLLVIRVKQSQEQLQEKERLLRAVLDGASEGVYGLDLKGRTTFANKSAQSILGYSFEEMLGKSQHDLIHHHYPDGKKYPRTKCKIYKAFTEGQTSNVVDEVFWNKNGDPVPVEYSASPFYAEDNSVAGAVVVFRDITEDVKAQEAKKEAENLYKMLADYGNDIIIMADANQIVQYVSPSFERHLGLSPKEAIGKHSWNRVHPKDNEEWFPRWYETVFDKKRTCLSQLRFRHKDGHYISFECLCSPIKKGNGEVTGHVAACRDITDRLEAENLLKMLAENTSDSIALRDEKGNILYVTPSVEKHLGYPAEELIGLGPWLNKLHPDDQHKADLMMETVYQKGEPLITEVRIESAKGEYVWFESRVEPIKNETGQVIAAVSTSRNISEFKQAESEAARLGRIIDSSLNEIFVFDADTLKFLSVNRGARENLGYSMEALKEMSPFHIVPRYKEDEFKNLVAPLLSGEKEQIYFETVQRRKDGSDYDVEIYLQLVSHGEKPVFVAFCEDITEKKIATEKLRQAQKMEAVGQLTGGIAHDFNNMLTAVIGGLRLMESEDLTDNAREYLSLALESSQRGAELTGRLLTFSRRQVLAPNIIDVCEIVQGMETLIKSTVGETVKLHLNVGKDSYFSKIDKAEFESVLLNLCINARDAMPSGGNLSIEISKISVNGENVADPGLKKSVYVLVTVSDTGLGMTEEVRKKALEPFFTTKGVGKGTGLGLSQVFGFVKQSGGVMNIYSEPGHGTSIKIYLPMLSQDQAARSSTEQAREMLKDPVTRSNLRGKTILLVDDDQSIRRLARKALEAHGYKVRTAADGGEALEAIGEKSEYDMLITDMVMPDDVTGIEIAKAFGQRFKGAPVLFCSGYPEKILRSNGRLAVTGEVLPKPYDLTALLTKVDQLLIIAKIENEAPSGVGSE